MSYFFLYVFHKIISKKVRTISFVLYIMINKFKVLSAVFRSKIFVFYLRNCK